MKHVSGQRVRVVASLMVVLAGLGLVACGSSNHSTQPAATVHTSSPSAPTPALTGVVSEATRGLVNAKGDAHIALAAIHPLTQFTGPTPVAPPKGKFKATVVECAPVGGCLNVAQDVAATFKKFGWDVTTTAGDGTPSSYQSAYSSAMNSGAKVIVGVAVPGVLVAQQLAQAKAKGVVTINSGGIPASGPGYTGYVDSREALSKSLLGASMTVETAGKANVIFLDAQGRPDLGVQAGVEFLKQNCSTCTVSTQTWNTADFLNPVTAGQKTQAVVAANPSANYLVWPTDGLPLQPAVAAIAQAGKASSLKLVSSDLDPPAFALLKAGSVHTLTAASQEWGALATVDAAFRGLENKPIPSSDAWGIGVGLVTAANAPRGAPSYVTIDRYVQRKLNFVAPYQKAWGVDLSSIG